MESISDWAFFAIVGWWDMARKKEWMAETICVGE